MFIISILFISFQFVIIITKEATNPKYRIGTQKIYTVVPTL